MNDYKHIAFEIENGVAYIEINNPPVNVLHSTTILELSQCMDGLSERSDVKAIVITGRGKFFVAGADIKEFEPIIGDEARGTELSIAGQSLFNKIERFKKPVIAAINGICLGGGLELAMSCHLRLAANEAVMGLPELKLGLIPGYGGTQRLARITGKAKALELILTSRSIDGQEAQRIGLVNQSVPSGELTDTAKRFAEEIVSDKSAVSISATLEAVTRGMEIPLEEGLKLEAQLFGNLFGTADMKEGVRAFIEKRKARFIDK